LDLVLGKLPEIAESQRGTGTRNKGKIYDRKSEYKSDLSTAYNTEYSVQSKPLVEETDVD
jgi:hypothetical protein